MLSFKSQILFSKHSRLRPDTNDGAQISVVRLGHKRKWCHARVMSVLPIKADMRQREWHVR
jgi:hypothetical protein